MTTGRSRLAYVVYRALLLAYPAEFRRANGQECAEMFAALLADTRVPVARLRLWARTIVTVGRDGLRARIGDRRPSGPERWGWMPAVARLARDAVRGARLWRHDTLQAAIVIVSLGVGVGVVVAILTFTRTLLAAAPPVPDPASLVAIGAIRNGDVDMAFTPSEARSLGPSLSSLDAVVAERFGWAWLTTSDEAEELEGSLVSYEYFDALRLAPAAGRFFHAADQGRLPPHGVIVISDRLWARRFGRVASTIGATVDVNGRPVQIIGVAPGGFRGPYAGQSRDVWMPHDLRDESGRGGASVLERAGGTFQLVARLAPVATVAEAQAELSGRLAQLPPRDREGPTAPTALVERVRGAAPDYRETYADTPALAGGVAAALILIVGVNVAGLLLARNLDRRSEMVMRLALGGSRRGLVAQLAAESLPVAAAAVVVSVPVAILLQRLMPAWFAYGLPGLELRIGVGQVAAAGAAALVTMMIATVIPAWIAARQVAAGGTRRAGGAVAGPSGRATRGLIGAQVALSLMLLTGAATMTRSLAAVVGSAGRDPGTVLHYRLRPSRAGYDRGRAERFQRDVLDRLGQMANVRGAAFATVGPDRGWCCPVAVSPAETPDVRTMDVDNNAVTPAYFDVLGIPIDAGRPFGPDDDARAEGVAIVNRALADRLWPDANPLGRRIRAGDDIRTVIGVARDVHPGRPGEGPVPYVWFPFWQSSSVDARLFARLGGATAEVDRSVQAAIRAAGPEVHVGQAGTLLERITLTHAPQRALSRLFQLCGGLALGLTAVGLFGQLATMVRRRRREIAIRLSLGASPRRVRDGLALSVLALVGSGIAVGLVAAWAQGQWLAAYVFGVEPAAPGVLGTATAILAAVGVVSVIAPARAASRVDPAVLLRSD